MDESAVVIEVNDLPSGVHLVRQSRGHVTYIYVTPEARAELADLLPVSGGPIPKPRSA